MSHNTSPVSSPLVVFSLGCLLLACGQVPTSEGLSENLENSVTVDAIESVLVRAASEGTLAVGSVCLGVRESDADVYSPLDASVVKRLSNASSAERRVFSVDQCDVQRVGDLIVGVYVSGEPEPRQRASLLSLEPVYLYSRTELLVAVSIIVAPKSGAGYRARFTLDKKSREWKLVGTESTWVG